MDKEANQPHKDKDNGSGDSPYNILFNCGSAAMKLPVIGVWKDRNHHQHYNDVRSDDLTEVGLNRLVILRFIALILEIQKIIHLKSVE